MHFRGEGKTPYSHLLSWRGKILPDALPGGRQNAYISELNARPHFTRCTSGGKAKRRPYGSPAPANILPDALPGGRQNNLDALNEFGLNFTRCTSGGKAKPAQVSVFASEDILPDALPGGRQNQLLHWHRLRAFYPMHFRGEGKTALPQSSYYCDFTRCTSGGKAKRA